MDVRTITETEVPAFQDLLDSAFGADPDPEERASWRPLVEIDRTLAAFDGGTMVGTAAVFTFDMTIPGGPAPAAGVTGVAVAPTHRRRGVLTSLMRRQLDEIRDRGTEAFATLWASEAPIYGRFGYGVAGRRWSLDVQASDPVFDGRPPAGRVRLIDAAALREVAPALYDAVRAERPGVISRSPARWEHRIADYPAHRHGASAQRIVAYDDADGRTTGYAIYRMKPDWADGVPRGVVRVKEVIALDADTHAGLWRFLLGIDLTTSVSWDNAPPDDAILSRLRDARTARVGLSDGIYVRLLDVPAALAGRRYATSGQVTFEVTDTFGGWAAGKWTLAATPDGATCVAATASPDLTLSATDLGAAYFGDTTLLSLADAGRVDEHAPGAALAASRVLAWHRGAWCPEIF